MLLYNVVSILVCLYLNVQFVSCDVATNQAVVIDNSKYFFENFKKIRVTLNDNIKHGLDNIEIHFVLVTINDQNATLKTKNSSKLEFLASLNSIEVPVNSSLDRKAMVITGIEMALLECPSNAIIHVITQASAKDYDKLDAVKKLCREKNSKVKFLVTEGLALCDMIAYGGIEAACP